MEFSDNQQKRIWLSPPHMSGAEINFVQEAFESNWIAPVGPHIDAFEKEVANYIQVEHAVALSSGTAAIHLALQLLNVQKGDIVLCQSLTFVASANPILYQGATPVFIDSEKETWNLCPNALEKALKHYAALGKRPKAVIAVHLYGMPCRLDEIAGLCEKYDVPLIEDAAEALGSTYRDKKAGSFGTLSILSFNGNKLITTSGGGMLLSHQQGYIDKAKFLSSQARDPAPYYEHSQMGFNYRMSNVCAAIGRGQFTVLEDRVQKRQNNFQFYKKQLAEIPGITFQPDLGPSKSNRWLTAILLDPQLISPENLRQCLEEQNIESRPIWKPLHTQPLFQDAVFFGGSISEELFRTGLCLPSGSDLSEIELLRISEAIKEKATLA